MTCWRRLTPTRQRRFLFNVARCEVNHTLGAIWSCEVRLLLWRYVLNFPELRNRRLLILTVGATDRCDAGWRAFGHALEDWVLPRRKVVAHNGSARSCSGHALDINAPIEAARASQRHR